MKNIERFLDFDGKRISILLNHGEWWVAIKPICEALGTEYTRQFKNLKEHKILSELLAEQPMVGADGKLRKMLCLPEKFIYGWLFSINSENENLIAYQKECYEVLYKHFHGKMTERMNILTERVANYEEMEHLKTHEALVHYKNLELSNKKLAKKLQLLDQDLITGQISFDLDK